MIDEGTRNLISEVMTFRHDISSVLSAMQHAPEARDSGDRSIMRRTLSDLEALSSDVEDAYKALVDEGIVADVLRSAHNRLVKIYERYSSASEETPHGERIAELMDTAENIAYVARRVEQD